MAKRFHLFLVALLCLAPWTATAAALDLIEHFKQNRSVEEDKALIDSMDARAINSLVDDEGRTALFYCRHLGMTLLLLAGADANTRDHAGRSPAFRTVSRSSDDAFPIMLDLLLLAHTDPNARDDEGTSLLAHAAREGNLPAVTLLLAAGADPAPEDARGDRTPLFFALQRPDGRIADVLRNFHPGPAAPEGRAVPIDPAGRGLADAARAGNLLEISGAVANGAEVNARDKDGATALFRAVAERRADVVALLLLKGANPNVAKNDGQSPLMQCATLCDMASERMLMDLIVAGADARATARDGTTALSQAVHCCNDTAAQWMIWRGADLDVHSPDGTLMQGAALHPDWPSMIALLRNAGVTDPVEPLAKLKDPALFDVVRTGTAADVAAELRKDPRVDVTNRYDQTALEWAICYDKTEVIDLLLQHGADINHQHRYNGEHIIHVLARATNETGTSPATKIENLIKRGANPNLTMHDGCTPLMVAAREGALPTTIDFLLSVTSDINARDKQGLTALALARQHGHFEAAQLLESHGAVE